MGIRYFKISEKGTHIGILILTGNKFITSSTVLFPSASDPVDFFGCLSTLVTITSGGFADALLDLRDEPL